MNWSAKSVNRNYVGGSISSRPAGLLPHVTEQNGVQQTDAALTSVQLYEEPLRHIYTENRAWTEDPRSRKCLQFRQTSLWWETRDVFQVLIIFKLLTNTNYTTQHLSANHWSLRIKQFHFNVNKPSTTSRFCRYPSCGSHSREEIRWLCLIQRVLLSLHMGKICRITVMRPSALWVSSKISVSLISCGGEEAGQREGDIIDFTHSIVCLDIN